MPDMYGFRYESCTGRYADWAVSAYVWRGTGISFWGNCSADENNQDWYRRRWVYSWRRDCTFQTWKNICKQNKICSCTLHRYDWRRSRSQACWDPGCRLWPYRRENACWACICKLRRRRRCSSLHSTGRKSKRSWKNSGSGMYRSWDR